MGPPHPEYVPDGNGDNFGFPADTICGLPYAPHVVFVGLP